MPSVFEKIEMPKNYKTRKSACSNYKKHNTIKFLLAITPFGTVTFVYQYWGGTVSDQILIGESRLLQLVEYGDVLLADWGFGVSDSVTIHYATKEIPISTWCKSQLNQKHMEISKKLSQVRIHVEQVIGLLKNKYALLQGGLPISMLKHKDDWHVCNIDRILVVCASLVNLCK